MAFGEGCGMHPLYVFPPLCQNVWHLRAETFWLQMLTYGSLFAVAFVNIVYYVTMAARLLNRGRINLVNIVVKRFICMAKLTWNMKSASQNWPLQISAESLWKEKRLDFDPQNKEWRNYSEPVMTSSILLWFWIEFVTYFHTNKFGLNWPSNNGNKEGWSPPYLVNFSDPVPFGVKYLRLILLVH